MDPLKRVSCAALPPWEVILDATACSWDQQRYIGHVYLMPLAEAMSRFGKSEDVFSTRSYSKWIEDNKTAGGQSFNTLAGDGAGASSSEQWIRVAELYDIEDDKLLVWSEDYNGGLDYLFTGVKVQVGALPPNPEQEDAEDELENQHETTGIPYKSASGRPVVPILPLYFSRDPDTPLRGYSLIHRSRDQFREMNLMRTYQAQGVRRLARQWLVRAGFLSEDGAAKISQGLDWEFIEIDLPPGTPLEGNMMPVDNPPIPADVGLYASTVENDIREAGLLAPFTRGETTNTTATEQQLLASYTSTELGRMARVRDELITSIAYTYNVMLSVVLGDDAEPLSLPNPVGPTVLSADDLTGDFRYWAVDAGGTPMSDLMKQQTLERMAPTLVQLGVPAALVLEEIVRTFQLPESFVIAAREAAAAQETGPSPEGAPAPLPPEEGEL